MKRARPNRSISFAIAGVVALTAVAAVAAGDNGFWLSPANVRTFNGLPVIMVSEALFQPQTPQPQGLLAIPGTSRLASVGPSLLQEPLQWETPLTTVDARLYAMFSAVDLNMNMYNNPPDPPSNPDPADGATDVPVDTEVCWTCSDPDGDTLRYDVYFGTAEDPPLVANDIYDNCWAPPTALDYGVTYYWKIVAKDTETFTEGDVWHFTTRSENHAPDDPTNPFPADGASGMATDLEMSWTCSDPDGDVLTYDLYFGTEADPPLYAEGLPDARYSMAGMATDTTYYWKGVASDGELMTEGPVWSFSTLSGDNQPPAEPHDPNPPDGSTGIGVNLTLEWQCDDPDGDTLFYDIYFGTDDPLPLLVSDHTETRYTMTTTLEYFTVYKWQVVAKDAQYEVPGPVWQFRTEFFGDSMAPTSTFTDPQDGQCLTESTYTVTGTVVDEGEQEVSGVDRVEVSTDGGGTWNEAVVAEPGSANTTWSYEWAIPGDGEYTLMVRAYDLAGNIETGELATVTVTVDTVLPTIWAAGWWDTDYTFDNGGSLNFGAIAPDDDIETIEIYFLGQPTGVYLADDGTQGDVTPGDGLWTLAFPYLPPYSIPRGVYRFELVASDKCGNQSMMWPNIEVFEGAGSYAAAPEIPSWQELMRAELNKGAPGPNRPQVWVGGFYDSYITTEGGGTLTILAYVMDPDGASDIHQVEVTVGGVGTGVYLVDDGTQGDWAANDGLYMLVAPVDPGVVPAGEYSIEIVATDMSGNESLAWPYLTVE